MEAFGPAKIRNCLKCDKSFRSEGPANRLCGDCNKENSKWAVPRVEVLKSDRKMLP